MNAGRIKNILLSLNSYLTNNEARKGQIIFSLNVKNEVENNTILNQVDQNRW